MTNSYLTTFRTFRWLPFSLLHQAMSSQPSITAVVFCWLVTLQPSKSRHRHLTRGIVLLFSLLTTSYFGLLLLPAYQSTLFGQFSPAPSTSGIEHLPAEHLHQFHPVGE